MSIIFPESWSPLKFPHVRAELLEYLADAATPDLWQETAEVEFLVHFIFDDHDFEPIDKTIGKIFLDSAEAAAMSDFVFALNVAIGPRSKSLARLKQKDWASVARTAAHALAILSKSGAPTYD